METKVQGFTAHALTRKGKRIYTSPKFATRDEAIENAKASRPDHWRISSGYGYDGSLHILWTEPNYDGYDYGLDKK
jgi:methylmalonyl-CoA mutase cobalamin-binding subunit